MSEIFQAIGLGLRWWWLNVRHVLICARMALISFFLGGCAQPVPAAPRDPHLTHAAAISDRIDGKTIVITEWLKSH